MVVICKQICTADTCTESYDKFMGSDISVDEHNNSIDCECAKDQIAEADPDDFSSCFHSRVVVSEIFRDYLFPLNFFSSLK